MGHGQKNANRGEAINRNAARVSKLAEKLKELGGILKKVKAELKEEIEEYTAVVDEYFVEIEERLRLLERPWWKKLFRMDLELPAATHEGLDPDQIERLAAEIQTEVKEVRNVEGREEEDPTKEPAHTEPPPSGDGPEDARTEEKKGEA